jgi:hypothetical protein
MVTSSCSRLLTVLTILITVFWGLVHGYVYWFLWVNPLVAHRLTIFFHSFTVAAAGAGGSGNLLGAPVIYWGLYIYWRMVF